MRLFKWLLSGLIFVGFGTGALAPSPGAARGAARGAAALGTVVPGAMRDWQIVKPDKGMGDWPAHLQGAMLSYIDEDAQFSAAVVELKLDDGRTRLFPLRLFSAADRAYAEQFRAAHADNTNLDTPYITRYTDYRPDRDPTVHFYDSRHFLFQWGSDETGSGKIAITDPTFIPSRAAYFEKIWNFFEKSGAPMPMADKPAAQRFKIAVYITGTGLAKQKEGFAFGGESIMMNPAALGPGSSVVPHEFTHTIQFYTGGFRDAPDVGWFWECHANWSGHRFDPDYAPAIEVWMEREQYELNSSRMNYGSWPFLQVLSEDPRFGPGFCYRIWQKNRRNAQGASLEDPLQTIMRLAVDEGKWKGNGLTDFGDLMGNLAARRCGWDFKDQYVYQRASRGLAQWNEAPLRSLTWIEPVPDRIGWWRPIYSQTPRMFGINAISLVLTPGAGTAHVSFHGIVDEAEASDWRVTLVAAGPAGRVRYSKMLRGPQGDLSLTVAPGDKEWYLAVAATPQKYIPLAFRPGYNKKRRFPYEVSFTGCTPQTNRIRGARADAPVDGTRHPNGGGFVARGAHVAATAYVGPDARVLNGAVVSDRARIEDHAVIEDRARISGDAVVDGWACVRGEARVMDQARVRDGVLVEGRAVIRDHARVLEYVHIDGDGIFGGGAMARGWGEIHLSSKTRVGGDTIFGEDLEVYMDTAGQPELNSGLIYGFMAADQFKTDVKPMGGLYAHWTFNEPRREVLKDENADCDGVLRGAPAFVKDEGHFALSLNGKTQYAVLEGQIVDSAALTFDLNLKWKGGPAGQRVFSFGGASGGLYFTPSDEHNHATFVIHSGARTAALSLPGPLPQDQWKHIIITVGDGAARIYVNGRLAAQNTAFDLAPEDARATGGFLGRGLAGNDFAGLLGDFAIYRKVVAPAAL